MAIHFCEGCGIFHDPNRPGTRDVCETIEELRERVVRISDDQLSFPMIMATADRAHVIDNRFTDPFEWEVRVLHRDEFSMEVTTDAGEAWTIYEADIRRGLVTVLPATKEEA